MAEKLLDRSKDFVQSLDRGLSIMMVFSAENSKLTLSEVAELTGFTRATARRFLHTLESLNYVGSSGRYFFLKPRVLELGYAYLNSFSLVSTAQGHLEEMATEVHESCSASVLIGQNVIYVCRASGNRLMSINLAVGTQLPAFATSMGRVLLASMTEAELANYFGSANREKFTPMTVIDEGELRKIIAKARKDSYAVVVGQLEEGVESVSVPIHGKDGKVLAAANVSAHPSQISQEELVTKLLPRLQKCVAEIERDLNLEN